MKLEGSRRLLVALALVPLLAGVALAWSPAMFACQDDGVARARCCCPDEVHRAPVPRDASPILSAACCCDETQVQAPTTPVATESRAVQTSRHFAAASPSLPMLASSPPALRAAPAAARAQPPPAFPILLAKRSFLI
jgi:hypothetical protein